MNDRHFAIIKDTIKELEELNFTKELARETVFDPRGVEMVEVKQSTPIFSHICLVPLFDVHGAAVGSNAVREEKAVLFVKNTANAFCVMGGDTVNSIIVPGQNAHDDKFGNQRAIARAIDLYSTIVDKIPLILDGNHDGENGNRFSASNMSPTRHIADGLRTYDPVNHGWNGPQHCRFGALLKFYVPTNDNKRDLKTISIYLHHGSGRGSSPASSIDNEYNKAISYINRRCGQMLDVVITGHHHSNSTGVITQEVPIVENGRYIDVLRGTATVISESTLQEVSNYALAAGLKPADSNVYIYDMYIGRNLRKTEEDPRDYKLYITRIPMFRQNSNEYTDEAVQYMRQYQEPDINKITSSIKSTNSDNINKRLKNQSKKFGTVDLIATYLKSKHSKEEGTNPKPDLPDDDNVM